MSASECGSRLTSESCPASEKTCSTLASAGWQSAWKQKYASSFTVFSPPPKYTMLILYSCPAYSYPACYAVSGEHSSWLELWHAEKVTLWKFQMIWVGWFVYIQFECNYLVVASCSLSLSLAAAIRKGRLYCLYWKIDIPITYRLTMRLTIFSTNFKSLTSKQSFSCYGHCKATD